MNVSLQEYVEEIGQGLRGLPESRRQEELAEIRAHLNARIAAEQELGSDEATAVTSALRQFGSARRVRRGLRLAYARQRIMQGVARHTQLQPYHRRFFFFCLGVVFSPNVVSALWKNAGEGGWDTYNKVFAGVMALSALVVILMIPRGVRVAFASGLALTTAIAFLAPAWAGPLSWFPLAGIAFLHLLARRTQRRDEILPELNWRRVSKAK